MLTPLFSPVRVGMGSSVSQVPQLQQHADPAARVPQPALLPPGDLLGECPVAAQPAWPSPALSHPDTAASPGSAAGGPCGSSWTTTSPSTSWWPTHWPCSQVPPAWDGATAGTGSCPVGDCPSPAQLCTPSPTSSTWSATTRANKPPTAASPLSSPRCTCRAASG